MSQQLVEQFKTKFESLSGHVHLASDEKQAVERIQEVLNAAKPSCVAFSPLPGTMEKDLGNFCNQKQIKTLNHPYDGNALPDSLDQANIGISPAAFAVAEAGGFVEFATNDVDRLVSTLPRTHIGVFYGKDILETLDEAAPLLRTFFTENAGACTATFISGPSRSGDIEMKLTLGVHGPETAHTVIIGT